MIVKDAQCLGSGATETFHLCLSGDEKHVTYNLACWWAKNVTASYLFGA